MKNLTTFVGILALSSSTLYGSGVRGKSGQDDPSDQRTRHYSYTKKSQPTDHDPSKDKKIGFELPIEETEVLTSCNLRYIGGYFAPVNTMLAQDGVYNTVSGNNEQKDIIYYKEPWANGVGVSLQHTNGKGLSFRMNYEWLGTDPDKKDLFSKDGTYADAASTLGNSAVSGDATQVTGVSARHRLHSRNLGQISLENSCITNEFQNLFVSAGIGGDIENIHQSCLYSYTETTDDGGLINKHIEDEKIFGGGPFLTMSVAKALVNNFGVYGRIIFKTLITSVQLTAQEQEFSGSVSNGFKTNSQETFNRMFNQQEVGFGAFYHYAMENGGHLGFDISWGGGFSSDGTTMFSSTSGNGGLRPQGLAWELLRVGVSAYF